jgi:hypothetical protein
VCFPLFKALSIKNQMEDSNMDIKVKESWLLKTLISLRTISPRLLWTIMSLYWLASLFLSYGYSDTNIISAAGGVTTIFGLLQFITLSIPLSVEELEEPEELTAEQQREKILKNHELQVRGLRLTIIGTLVWAYGWLLPF